MPTPLTYARAKRMRREPTEAERRLWFHLRGKHLNGYKFYRQVPVGPYIVDFICHRHALVIEVDGATHGGDHEMEYDQRRTAFLQQRGLRVHRVPNLDVFTTMEGVLEGILELLESRAR